MVEITIFMEGGAFEPNQAAATAENTQSLRQALHRIFSELLGKEVSISIKMRGGYRSAIKKYIDDTSPNIYLYADLDGPRDSIPDWFTKIATENPFKIICIPEEKKTKIFFMIQEMEAWILKQPGSIEAWGTRNAYNRRHKDVRTIADHYSIVGKNIEEINKPSRILYAILMYFFENPSTGKKIKYGKLKSAPSLLDSLNVEQLKEQDSEIKRFCTTIDNNLYDLDQT